MARPFKIRSRGRTDVLLAAAAGIEMQLELLLADGPERELLAARGLVLVLALALALRRWAPLVAVALTSGVFVAMERLPNGVADDLVVSFFALLFIAYSVGAHTDGPRLAFGVAILLAGGATAIALDDGGPDDLLFLATIIVGGPVLLGRLVSDRARLARALHEKAAALEQDRAEPAVSEERARIAGELHQMVSSALASMIDESDAAERLARRDPAAAAASLEAIESTGRDALGEIRLLLGVLRREDDVAALEPLPSLTHLDELIARTRASGLAVELRVEGDASALPAGLDLTAYRVVQEALAEALQAGGGRHATVRLRYGERELLLDVTDAGATARRDRPGLLGVHERVALYGGELVAEPLGTGGHAVRAKLPLERAR
jgi:signal transduction histidine kinase